MAVLYRHAQVLEQQLGGFRTDEGAVLKKLKEVGVAVILIIYLTCMARPVVLLLACVRMGHPI